MRRTEGWIPNNSCASCTYWHRGIGVSHNHCDNPASQIEDSLDHRANGLETRTNTYLDDCSFWKPRQEVPDA